MFIKSYLNSKNQVKVSLENINYLNKENILWIASTVSTYFHFLGIKRENKNLKAHLIQNETNEDRLMTIDAVLQEESVSWGKKYYSNKGAFSDVQIKDIKTIIKNNNLNNKNKYPFYFIYETPFVYQDGDFTKGSIGKFLGERQFYVHTQPFFLNIFTNFRFLTWQREGRESVSKFETMFNQFIQQFTFKTVSVQEIDSEIVEENSNLSMYAPSYLEQTFFIVTKEGKKIKFKDIDPSDLEFIMLLGEVFTRLFSVALMNKVNQGKEINIQEIKGVFFSYQVLSESWTSQITHKLPNLQFFFTKK